MGDTKVTIKARTVTVTGKHGTLTRTFKHLAVDAQMVPGGKIRVQQWFGLKKQIACLRTFCSHVENMIMGVRRQFQYNMRLVYAHFPINQNIINGGKTIEIRNFLGEKVIRVVDAISDTKYIKSDLKDEVLVRGTDLEATSRSAALLHQSCLCKRKDIRKFLDGI